MTRILITGGCGFIGSNLTEFIISNTDWEVNVLDNLSTGSLENIKSIENYEERVTFFKGSMLNEGDITQSLHQCDYVVNLAAQTSVLNSIKDPFEDQRQNIIGLLKLLKKSSEFKIKKIVQGSSAAVMGKQTMPIHELKVPQPISPYGASKLAGEAYCSVFANVYDLDCVVLRFSNVYGPKSTNKTSVIAKFIKRILQGELIEIYGEGDQTRDFLYVFDLCEGIYNALIYNTGKFELFQLGTGKQTTINSLVDLLMKISEKHNLRVPQIKKTSPKSGEIIQSYTDISKATRDLDFHNKYSLEKGLNDTFTWFISNYQEYRS